MLKLLLLTLGTWSVLSLSLVGSLGFLLQLRQQRACAMGASAGGANLRAVRQQLDWQARSCRARTGEVILVARQSSPSWISAHRRPTRPRSWSTHKLHRYCCHEYRYIPCHWPPSAP